MPRLPQPRNRPPEGEPQNSTSRNSPSVPPRRASRLPQINIHEPRLQFRLPPRASRLSKPETETRKRHSQSATQNSSPKRARFRSRPLGSAPRKRSPHEKPPTDCENQTPKLRQPSFPNFSNREPQKFPSQINHALPQPQAESSNRSPKSFHRHFPKLFFPRLESHRKIPANSCREFLAFRRKTAPQKFPPSLSPP